MNKDSKRRGSREKRNYDRESSSVGGGGLGLKLDHNKVSEVHLSIMREAKDLTKKSADNKAAIFVVREDEYYLDPPSPPPSCIDTKSRTNLTD